MSFLDKITDRVGGFFDEVLLPEDVASSLRQASQHIEADRYKDALRILYRAHANHPSFHRTHHLIGVCQFHLQNYEEAWSAFGRAIDEREEADSHLYAGLCAEQLDRWHDARIHFQRGQEVAGHSEAEFDLLFGLGRIYLAQQRAGKAVRELTKAVKIQADQSDAAVALAKALLSRGKLDRCRQVLDEPAARKAGPDAQVLRGQLEEAQNHPSAALNAYVEVLEQRPSDAGALVGAGRTSLALGDGRAANSYLVRALDATGDDHGGELHCLLGQTNEARANPEQALQQYRLSLAADDPPARARLGAGRLLAELGEFDAARTHFRALLDDGPPTQSIHRQAVVGLARIDLQANDLVGARRGLDDFVQAADAPGADIFDMLGQVALAAGDPAEAVVAFKQAVRTADQDAVGPIERRLHGALDALTFDWSLPDTLDDATDLVDTLAQVRDFVGSDPQIDHFLAPVQHMLAAVNAPLSIAVVGEFNAGKSTLLNAVIGEEVVPMGVLPTTAHTCFIRYGPRKAARVVGTDGEVTEVTLAEAKDQMKRDAGAIDHLELRYPHPDLRSVEFWDTPGFNALEDAHEQAASRALDEAEAILWVLDANQVLAQTEFERIEALAAGSERLIILLNKIDRLGPADQRQHSVDELLDYVQHNAAGRYAGCFAISAREALADAAATTEPTGPTQAGNFEAFRRALDTRIIQRSGRIKTLELTRQLRQLVDDISTFQTDLVDTYNTLERRAQDLASWVDPLGQTQPDEHARREARAVEDRFDFVLTGIEREIRDSLKSRGTWWARRVLPDEDKSFILELLDERLADVLERSRRDVLADVDQFERRVAGRIGPVVQALSLADARALNRRLEGFFDDVRMLELLLEERVYGQLRARATGQIEAAGRAALEDIEAHADAAPTSWRASLRRLIPDPREHLHRQLGAWYAEFFLAASRFSDRVQRDLILLKLEAEHHFDVSALDRLVDESSQVV